MKKILKKSAIWSGGIIAFLVLISVIIVLLFEKPIGRRLVRAVNNQLKTELQIRDFELSVLSTFPNVSADLLGVVVGDALGGKLLEAERVAFKFSLLSLLSDNIKVQTISIEEGIINIIEADKKGRNNYTIFSASTEEETAAEGDNSSFGLSLDKAFLSDVSIAYLDIPKRQRILIKIKDGSVSGKLADRNLSLSSESAMVVRGLEFSGEKYLEGKALSYDLDLDIDLEKSKYSVKKGNLKIGAHRFALGGWVREAGDYREMDLTVKGEEANLSSLISLLPAAWYEQYFKDFESDGIFSFGATIKGRMDDKRNPFIEVDFGLVDGEIEAAILGSPLKDVQIKAHYSNGKYASSRSSTFELQQFEAILERDKLQAALEIKNFDNPFVDFSADGNLSIHLLYKMFGNPALTDGGGEVEFQNIRVNGYYRDMVDMNRISRVSFDGALIFDDAFIAIEGERLLVDRGKVTIQNNNLAVDDLRLEGPGTDLTVEGDFSNLLPVLFSDTKKGKADSELRFHARLDAESLDIDRLMAFSSIPFNADNFNEEQIDSIKALQISKRARFTRLLKGTFESNIQSFNYRAIEGKSFKGRLTFDNNIMEIEGDTRAMGGNFVVSGSAFFFSEPKLELKLICEGVNIHTFFQQMENFGQDIVVAENIKGRLESKMAIYAFWDKEGNFLTDKLRVLADIRLEEGELVDLEMLYAFTDFLKLKDLRRINVQTLQNWMEISESTVYIPVMFIQSNALNLTVSGQHSFENEVEYNFKVNAGQVLANKLKIHDPTLDPLPAKRSGFFNLYYKLWGTIEDYEIRSSRRQILSDFKETEQKKEEIKDKLVAAFGPIINLEEPVGWRDEIPEFEGVTEEGDPEFLDGF